MFPFTSEESIPSTYVKNENSDAIINIADATNLSRSLFFTTQLRPVVDTTSAIGDGLKEVVQAAEYALCGKNKEWDYYLLVPSWLPYNKNMIKS